MQYYTLILLLLAFLLTPLVSRTGDGEHGWPPPVSERFFCYQGPYDSLGAVDDIADVISQYGIVVVTHGFYLPLSVWTNGSCVDVNYLQMPALLKKVRERNPAVRIFGYVSATADHPNGCWPQPSVAMADCPEGNCADFKLWTDLWCFLETAYPGVEVDGMFIDLVHPALIGQHVRDSVFSYVKTKKKKILVNALSDSIGVSFALASPKLTSDDLILVEGYHTIAGYENTQTARMSALLKASGRPWIALTSEKANAAVSCSSEKAKAAYALMKENGGIAFCYQSSDLGTQSYRWTHCSSGPVSVSNNRNRNSPPEGLLLQPVFPNPFNGTTRIRYSVERPIQIRIAVFTILGQMVTILREGPVMPGVYEIDFNAQGLSSGAYMLVVDTQNERQVRPMLLTQ